MGDAAGIGPEIIAKALRRKDVYSLCQPIVIGSSAILEKACQRIPSTVDTVRNRTTLPSTVGAVSNRTTLRSEQTEATLKINSINTPEQASAMYGTIDVLDVSSISPEEIYHGTIDTRAGAAAVKAIEAATHLAMLGELDAITTAPISKASINRAGYPYPGHTEMLAAFTNTPDVVMMLCTPEALTANAGSSLGNKHIGFAVSFVTNHIPLADVPKSLSIEKIVKVIRITQQALIRCGISEPRLAVAGLNPHAGENGIFGDEEERLIRPAISQAQTPNATIEGPLPADVLFVKAKQGHWHAVIAMYHDQGNIPIKLLGFGELVNVTLGLPIIRTSVDHGTAFDIAGKGIASESSLVAALNCAAQLAK